MDNNFDNWYDEENSFKDSDDSALTQFINNYRMSNGKEELIDDYGIYDYFKYCGKYNLLKMVANIRDNLYVINTAPGYISHDVLAADIRLRYGSFNCFIGSAGDDLVVYAGKELTSNELFILIGIFNELKNYFLETNINKKIVLIGEVFGNRFNDSNDCLNIDELIDTLTELRKEVDLDHPKGLSTGEDDFV